MAINKARRTYHAPTVPRDVGQQDIISVPTWLSTSQPRWRLSERTCLSLLVIAIAGYVLIFSLASAAKFWWFGQGHDLVLHEQAIWNTTHGRIFEVTGFVHPARLFGYDPYLIELLVVPIYALLPSVHTLFVLQSLALGLGALAVWRIARYESLTPMIALLGALLYLAYPTVQYTNLDAFRERSFGLCFFLWAMWAFRQERWRTFVVFLVLLIICRLEAALYASCFGIYALLIGRRGRYVFVPLIFGLAYFFLGNFVFVPLVNGGQPVSYVYEYFQPLGHTMGEVLRTIVTRPIYTFEETFRWSKLTYLSLLLLPAAGLPLLAPRELVFTIPILGLNLLATKPQLSDVRYWYSALLVGPLVVAAVVGLRRIQQRSPSVRRQPWLAIVPVAICIVAANLVPLNPIVSLLRHHEPPARRAIAEAVVAQLPPDARVAASSRIAPHLLRRYLYYYPLADQSVLPELDYIVADVASDSFSDPPSRAQLEAVQHSGDWQLILDEQGYQLFKRRKPETR